jgi:hypothetical protein
MTDNDAIDPTLPGADLADKVARFDAAAYGRATARLHDAPQLLDRDDLEQLHIVRGAPGVDDARSRRDAAVAAIAAEQRQAEPPELDPRTPVDFRILTMALDGEAPAINALFDATNARVAALETDAAALRDQVNALEGAVSELRDQVVELQTQAATR